MKTILLALGAISLSSSIALAQVFNGSLNYQADVVASGLQRPWAITAAPDGRFYVTEKRGAIVVFSQGKRLGHLRGLPQTIAVVGQGGLMDIEFHPHFQKNGFVYLSYSTHQGVRRGAGAQTRISRFRLKGRQLSDEKILIQGGYGTDGAHFGSRLAFDKNGFLFATFGERHQKELAQDLKYLNGKVIRLTSDGQIPKSNPFFNRAGVKKAIFTLGHRNPQGIAIHPTLNFPLISEHGPTGYDAKIPGYGGVDKADEVNALRAGGNYGWPVVFGDPRILPWTNAMKAFRRRHKVIMPLKEYTRPDGIAPSGVAFYTGSQFSRWKNDFFISALRGYIIRLKFSNKGQVLEQERLIPRGYSRLRDITVGHDGYLYALSDTQNGKIIRLRPATGRPSTSPNPPPPTHPNSIFAEVQKVVSRHRCTNCHSELADLTHLPNSWVGQSQKTSKLWQAVASGRMPLGPDRLNKLELNIIRRWLKHLAEN